MKAPFHIIQYLLFASLIILVASLSVYLISDPTPPPFGCSVTSEPEFYCGTKSNRITYEGSIDSITLNKYEKGEKLYKESGCTSCHDVFEKKVGPALNHISERRNRVWIQKAIIDFQKLVDKKDKTALALSKEYNNMAMPIHDFLSKEDIDLIILYLDKSSSTSY